MHSREDEEREGVSEQKQGGGGLTQILCLRDLHGPRDLCGSNPSVVTVLNRGHNICLDPTGRNTVPVLHVCAALINIFQDTHSR